MVNKFADGNNIVFYILDTQRLEEKVTPKSFGYNYCSQPWSSSDVIVSMYKDQTHIAVVYFVNNVFDWLLKSVENKNVWLSEYL